MVYVDGYDKNWNENIPKMMIDSTPKTSQWPTCFWSTEKTKYKNDLNLILLDHYRKCDFENFLLMDLLFL